MRPSFLLCRPVFYPARVIFISGRNTKALSSHTGVFTLRQGSRYFLLQVGVPFSRGTSLSRKADNGFVCFNSQSVISQSLISQQNADCGLPHVNGGYRFLSACHWRYLSYLHFISPPIEEGESLLLFVDRPLCSGGVFFLQFSVPAILGFLSQTEAMEPFQLRLVIRLLLFLCL